MATRLNKFLSRAGVASRRGADELIAAGRVSVNGIVTAKLGITVKESDEVEVDGRPVQKAGGRLYYAMNKPEGFITTMADEEGRPTVQDLLGDIGERVYPVGRLDAASTGLLLLTNDGDFANAVAHPSSGKKKTYRVKASGHISEDKLRRLREGVVIDGRRTAPAEATLMKQGKESCLLEIVIGEGRNRQIRKMMEVLDMRVTELERTAIGSVRLGALKPGHYRKLRRDEIESFDTAQK